jgi:hypothetical protein
LHISRDKAPKLSFTATHRAIPLLNLKYGKKGEPYDSSDDSDDKSDVEIIPVGDVSLFRFYAQY